MRHRGLVSLLLLLVCSVGCRRPKAVPPKPDAAPPRGHFTVAWSPATGRGEVSERLASGDVLRTCFHCGYPGYTGGLIIGNISAPGMELRPQRPIRGYDSINVFCAQDESIWDLDEAAEYTYGWSENFGTGPDGKRLDYVRGRVLEHDDAHVVLTSENAGGCYQVTKVATTRAEWRYWIIATRIQNRCDHPVRFHFYTGDDPWIGRYASAEGDVGWTPAGLVRKETGFAAGELTAGGLYDLGNSDLGQTDKGFSNQADFFALDPTLPLPDFAGFANRFAHHPGEIDGQKPLENRTMIALNMGWRNRTLAPAASMLVTLALGVATTGEPGSVPRLPAIDDVAWSTWRHHGGLAPESGDVLFASERVELEVTEGQVAVSAEYYLWNASPNGQGLGIVYPIIVSKQILPPENVLVDGRTLPVLPGQDGQVYARFPVSIPPHEIRSFRVRYEQRLLGREAVYLVTSALRWPRPIDRAVFVIKCPAKWRKVTLSYPILRRATANGQTTLLSVMQPFRPEREIVLRWAGS
jgi:hypothetical protein